MLLLLVALFIFAGPLSSTEALANAIQLRAEALVRALPIGEREPGKADQDGARTIKRHVAPDRI